MIVGLGSNAFSQLNGEDYSGKQSSLPRGGATAGNDIAKFSPQTLMTFSRQTKPNVKISSTWDSVHISSFQSAQDLPVQTITTGRWKEMLDRSGTNRMLTDPAVSGGQMSTIVETNNSLILSAPTNIVTVSQDCALVSRQEQLPTGTTFGFCEDGHLYALLKNGNLHELSSSSHSDGKDTSSFDIQLLSLGPRIPTDGVCITQVACGGNHALLLSKTGAMFSFGLNSRGELGHGDIDARPLPTLIVALDGIVVKDIACGRWHCLALSEYGDVYSWGWNKHGQLGHSKQTPTVATPTLVEIYPGTLARARPMDECDMVEACDEVCIVSVSCGTRHSVALSDGGSVYGWGWNGYGQLGGDRNENVVPFPRTISLPGVMGVILIHCGCWNTLFLCNKDTQDS